MILVAVHSLDDCLAAAELAEARELPLGLVSFAGAGLSAGPAWFAGLAEATRRRHPAARLTFILDCLDSPGAVMAGLRMGLTDLAIRPDAVSAALADLAGQAGAHLHDGPLAAHDLRGAGDVRAALARLLAD